MDQSELTRVGVVGCGLMGAGIAEICARAGRDVAVVELDQRSLVAGRSRLESSLQRAVKDGKLDQAGADAAISRLTFSTEPGVLADRQLVIEAVIESEAEKLAVFAMMDKAVDSDDAVLASNTSSIPIMKLGMATTRPANVVGMHFFQPAQVLPLVEIVPSLLTSEATTEAAARFAADVLGKRVVRAQDRAGFVVNALLVPYLLSAIRMVESGFATAEDIDTGMVNGCAHPMGPLAVCDLVGLDTVLHVADSLYDEFKDRAYVPPPLLARMVEAGLLGRKSGRGFYEYGR
ncbi:MAG TPA: 3-hydroxybutyryl-CoA dehydrogenase [Acidimicrobiales bacterium]|nr:3-hydroxybutyryl-CoA dehydrogenase [Acidimicrobiales bacterium]